MGSGLPAGFGDRVFVTDTHVGGFDFIPPQLDRSVDAEPGLAWDRSGWPNNGRVYVVYTLEQKNESDNTEIFVRYSDGGATWSAPVRVNDDRTVNSQFLPKISLDPITGRIAVVWYAARNDLGTGGAGDTDGVPGRRPVLGRVQQRWADVHQQHSDQRGHVELPRRA